MVARRTILDRRRQHGRRPDQSRRLQRRTGRARHGRHRRAAGAALAREPGARLSGGRRGARAPRPRVLQGRRAFHALGHGDRCEKRRRDRRAGRRLPALPDRPGAVLRPAHDHAPAGVRPGQPAGRSVGWRHRRPRRAVRQRRRGVHHHRRVPRLVLDRDRHRGAVQPAAADHGLGPRKLLRPAVPGPRRDPDPAVHLHPGRAHGRIGACRPGAGAGAGRACHRAHHRHRPVSAAAVAATGGIGAGDASCSWRRSCSSSSASP